MKSAKGKKAQGLSASAPFGPRFPPAVRHTLGDQRQLGCKPLHMVGLLLQEAEGDELREVGVLVACLLEGLVQVALHQEGGIGGGGGCECAGVCAGRPTSRPHPRVRVSVRERGGEGGEGKGATEWQQGASACMWGQGARM